MAQGRTRQERPQQRAGGRGSAGQGIASQRQGKAARGGAARRRGDLLLESIYDAAAEVLREEGYAKLTFQEIARVAHTSRTVLYRRWETPLDLLHEVMIYRSAQALGGELIDKVRDTGSLRGDLICLLGLLQKIREAVSPEIMNVVLFETSQDNTGVLTIKNDIDLLDTQVIEKILGFAEARGEKVKALGEAALTLPFGLMRISFLWGAPTSGQAAIEQMVDEILLPVFLAP